MRTFTISTRARNGFLFAAAILCLGLAVRLAYTSHAAFKTSITRQTHGQLLITARLISLNIEQTIMQLSDVLHVIRDNQAVQRGLQGDISAIPSHELDTFLHANQVHAKELFLRDAAGRPVYRKTRAAGELTRAADTGRDRHDVDLILRERSISISSTFTSEEGGLMFFISQPVVANGAFVGSVGWLVDIGDLSKLLVNTVRVGNSGYALLIDAAGTLLGLPDQTQVGRPFLEKAKRLFPTRDWSVQEELLGRITAGEEGTATVDMVCFDADECQDEIMTKLIAFAPVRFGDSRWAVIMTLNGAELAAPIDEHSLWQLLTLGLLLSVMALAGLHRLRTERSTALVAGERKFRELFESMHDAFSLHEIILDDGGKPVDYRFLEVNPAFEALTGLKAADIVGRTVLEVLPETEPYWIEMYGRVALTGAPVAFEHESAALGRFYEGKAYRPAPGRFAVVFSDATERLKAEEALHQSEQRFRTLFEHMAEGVALHKVVYDDAGAAVDYRILEINPAYERHTGLPAAAARGTLASRLYGTGGPPHLDVFAEVAAGGPPHFFETYFAPLARHFSISVISPRAGQFATVFEDVTARKQREEELREKNVELERFIHMISHDLKSPLVTVKTFLGYLEQDLARADETKVAQDIAYISAAAGKMGTLLDELLEYSRVGRSVNPPSRVSVNELVDEARGLVAGRIAERGVRITAYETDVVLVGDRPRLVEIWQNLIDNAVKYLGDQTDPSVEIGVETGGGEPVFYVRDNGIGVESRFQEKVFGLFEKLEPGSEGTGLGLALVRRIVALYGGTIRLESEGPGKGSCFFFTLPGALAPSAERKDT